MRPLLPKHFLRKFPNRSVLSGVQRSAQAIAQKPTFVAAVVSLGLHAGLAASIPRLLPDTSEEDRAEAIETDVIALAPEDLAAFSERATAPPSRSRRSSRDFTDLNGRSLPNLSRGEDDETEARTSDASSFGWGSASSYYDWSDRDSREDDTQTYDATREDDFYRYWQQAEELRDRIEDSDATMGKEGGDGGNDDGGDENSESTGGDTDGKGLDEGTNSSGAGEGGDPGFNSGATYQAGLDSRRRYAEWAIAIQNAKGLSDDALEPGFIELPIPVPNTTGFRDLIGTRGIAGMLVKPDGNVDLLYLLSEFPSDELARAVLREFVLDGFDGCNLGVPNDTWTACGLDITFVGGGSTSGDTAGDGNDDEANGTDDGVDRGTDGGDPSPGSAPGAQPDGQSDRPSDKQPGQPADEQPDEQIANDLLALARTFESDTSMAIALQQTAPDYETWRAGVGEALGTARGDRLEFRPSVDTILYPSALDPAFDRSVTTVAIVGVAIDETATPIAETAEILRSTGNNLLDAVALGYAETTPQNWYIENLELAGDRDAIVVFAISFVEPEGGAPVGVEADPLLPEGGEPDTGTETP